MVGWSYTGYSLYMDLPLNISKAQSSTNISTGCVSTEALLSHNAPVLANSQWCTGGRRSRRRGVVWIGPAGVVLCYIISDEPSCAVLFSPWVKWCQASWLMCPPALIRGDSGFGYRSINRLTLNRLITCSQCGSEAHWNGKTWNDSTRTVLPWQHGCCVVRNLGV